MFTIIGLLLAAAFVLVLFSAAGKVALWIPVLLVILAELLRYVPLGR
jgi:hypothetical protein